MIELTGEGYGLAVRFDVLDGHEEAFDALTAETLGAICAEESGRLIRRVDSRCHAVCPSRLLRA